MDLEAIIVDRDRDEALRFILKVLEPKLRAKGEGCPRYEKRDGYLQLRGGLVYNVPGKRSEREGD